VYSCSVGTPATWPLKPVEVYWYESSVTLPYLAVIEITRSSLLA
jgi:hypothetical protein